MKIALVGCGRIAKKHFDCIQELGDDLQLVGVCDTVPERAKEAAEANKTEMFTDFDEMLASVKPQVVSICTPSGLHPVHGIKAARAGAHVITEKPIGISLQQVDKLIEACDQEKVKLFVVKQNRLNPTMQLLKKAIKNGRFGKIYLVQANVFWTRPQEYYDAAKWRGTWEFDGGAFMNQASHYVDALYWLNGPIESVIAETQTLARDIESEDTGVAVLKFRNGSIGSLNVTMLTYPKNMEGSITILGEKGSAKIGGTAMNLIENWEFSDYDEDDKIVLESNYQPPTVYGYGHHPYYHNVVSALTEGCEPNTDGRSGRKSLEMILAIYESNRTGRRISLPLQL